MEYPISSDEIFVVFKDYDRTEAENLAMFSWSASKGTTGRVSKLPKYEIFKDNHFIIMFYEISHVLIFCPA